MFSLILNFILLFKPSLLFGLCLIIDQLNEEKLHPHFLLSAAYIGDGVVNILDVVVAVNIVLSGEYQVSVDLNEDESVDIIAVLIIQGE